MILIVTAALCDYSRVVQIYFVIIVGVAVLII